MTDCKVWLVVCNLDLWYDIVTANAENKFQEESIMILAEKIMLLRKKHGLSQEELAEQLNVSRQSVSKWESAQSIPDLNKILLLSEFFGVSTDYLLKDEVEPEQSDTAQTQESAALRRVTMEEASRFLEINPKCALLDAVGTALCILSPVLLIVLAAVGEITGLPETLTGGAGLILLLLLVTGGVVCFMVSGKRMEQFAYLKTEDIDTDYGVSGMVKERLEAYAARHIRELVTGVVLCILCVLPLFAAFMLDSDIAGAFAVGVLLVMVAAGVFFIVRTHLIRNGFQMLLEQEDFSREKKNADTSSAASAVMGIYWTLMTAVYLAWSFVTMDWGRSWIIWPVAGVFSAAVHGVVSLIEKKNHKS